MLGPTVIMLARAAGMTEEDIVEMEKASDELAQFLFSRELTGEAILLFYLLKQVVALRSKSPGV